MAGRLKCSHHLGISIYQKNGFKRHISDVKFFNEFLNRFFNNLLFIVNDIIEKKLYLLSNLLFQKKVFK